MRTLKIAGFICLLLIVAYYNSPLYFWGFPEKFTEETSPDGRYKAEYYHPRYSLHASSYFERPFFVKIYDLKEKKLVVTSNIHEMRGMAKIRWPDAEEPSISLGTGMEYEVRPE